ncbi:MAG: O-antigen ligase family protein [Deltaproteobacteria bacterium]|nr:O-antigen ligase family protein [Deltaproteobacteria bacterium]
MLALTLAIAAFAAAMALPDHAVLILSALAGLALMRVVLANPTWAMALLLASPNIQYGVWASPIKVLSLLVMPPAVVQAARTRHARRGGGVFFLCIAAVVFWQLLVDLFMGHEFDPIQLVPAAGALATMAVMWFSLVDLRFLTAHVIAQAAALLALGATMPFFISLEQMGSEIARHGGLASAPNVLAASLARTLFFGVALFVGRDSHVMLRIAALAALAFGAYGQFAANSRAGVLAVVVGAAVMVLLSAEGISRRLAAAVATIGLASLAVSVAPYSFRERALAVFAFDTSATSDRVRLDELTSGRASLNASALACMDSSPLIGLGSTTFQRTVGAGYPVHNAYLAVGVGCGVPAMILLVFAEAAALAAGIRTTLRLRRYRVEAAAVVASAVAGVVDAMASPTFLTMQNLWILMLCAQLPALAANTRLAPDEPSPTRGRLSPRAAPLPPVALAGRQVHAHLD